MRKAVALALCSTCLVLVMWVTWFVGTGGYARLVLGHGVTRGTAFPAFERASWMPLRYLAVLFGVFGVLDATALYRHNPRHFGPAPQACYDPRGFVLVRLRRYGLIAFVLLYLPAVVWTLEPLRGPDPVAQVSLYASAALFASFILSRRPVGWSYGQLWKHLMEVLGAGMTSIAEKIGIR